MKEPKEQIEELEVRLATKCAEKEWFKGFAQALARQFPEEQKARLLETLEKGANSDDEVSSYSENDSGQHSL